MSVCVCVCVHVCVCEITHDDPILREYKVHRTDCISVCRVVDGCPGNTIHEINTEKC